MNHNLREQLTVLQEEKEDVERQAAQDSDEVGDEISILRARLEGAQQQVNYIKNFFVAL
jgi:hypothetical protein